MAEQELAQSAQDKVVQHGCKPHNGRETDIESAPGLNGEVVDAFLMDLR